tara:strand:+ start:337 stop:528 length:192 start_codon:yes stop_codon:yes gene_type:complete
MSDYTFKFEVNHLSLLLLNNAVNKYLETWPGGSPLEQQAIKEIQLEINRALLDASFLIDKSQD